MCAMNQTGRPTQTATIHRSYIHMHVQRHHKLPTLAGASQSHWLMTTINSFASTAKETAPSEPKKIAPTHYLSNHPAHSCDCCSHLPYPQRPYHRPATMHPARKPMLQPFYQALPPNSSKHLI